MVWSQGPVRVDRFSKQCSQPPRAEAETVHAEPQTGGALDCGRGGWSRQPPAASYSRTLV